MTDSERFEMKPDSHDLYCVDVPSRHRVHGLYGAIYRSAEEAQKGLFLRTSLTGITCLESQPVFFFFFQITECFDLVMIIE